MRTNIEIDDQLMAEAMKITGLASKKATVEYSLRQLVEAHRRMKALEEITGSGWIGDLDAMREGWGFQEDP